MPDSDYQKYVRFFTGLTLVVLLLTPVSGLFGIDEELKNISQNRDYEVQMEKIREASPFLEDTGGDGDEKDPAKIQYGQVVDVTKQAPGAFKVMPEGTKIQTLEGTRTVQQGEVVALDHAGNPYATTPKNILKRNTGFTENGYSNLATVDRSAVELQLFKNKFKNDLSFLPENLRADAAKLIDKNSSVSTYGKNIKTEYSTSAAMNPDASYVLGNDPKLALKIDLLREKGVDIKIYGSEYHSSFLTHMEVTENGVTRTYNLGDKINLSQWIDERLGITE